MGAGYRSKRRNDEGGSMPTKCHMCHVAASTDKYQ